MIDLTDVYLQKAEESLAAAASELANGRYNSSANRSYYAAFQAAIWALLRAGIQPRGSSGRWEHDFVQAQFSGQLIHRRKLYPANLRTTLPDLYYLRERADYTVHLLDEVRASRAHRRSEAFVRAVTQGGASR